MSKTGNRAKFDSGRDLVSIRAIRGYARRVAARFQPDRIVLFGSYAYGKPNVDSDVDLLVIMPARNQLDQAAKIRLAFDAPFPMDLIVRTPRRMQNRLNRGDSFTTEVATKGKILYEKNDQGMDQESGSGPRHRAAKQSK